MIKYNFIREDRITLKLDVPVITQTVMLDLSEQLLSEYKNSGEHEDILCVDEKGEKSLKRVATKPFSGELHELSLRAEEALEWMMDAGVEKANRVAGFYTDFPELPQKGQAFEIPKGVTIYSTHPSIPANGKVSGKRHSITVHSADIGYYFYAKWVSGQIRWAGTGGYWRWIKIDELLEMQQAEKQQENACV